MTDNEIKRSMISAREEYINIIKSELLGPGSEFSLPDAEHELISSTPKPLFRWHSVSAGERSQSG